MLFLKGFKNLLDVTHYRSEIVAIFLVPILACIALSLNSLLLIDDIPLKVNVIDWGQVWRCFYCHFILHLWLFSLSSGWVRPTVTSTWILPYSKAWLWFLLSLQITCIRNPLLWATDSVIDRRVSFLAHRHFCCQRGLNHRGAIIWAFVPIILKHNSPSITSCGSFPLLRISSRLWMIISP